MGNPSYYVPVHAKDANCNQNKEKKCFPTTIKCGLSGGTLTVTNALTVLATIEVNVPKECNPCILIQYTVSTNIPSDADNRAYLVRVFKNCANGYRVQVGTALPFNATSRTETISGFVCDCSNCGEYECCSYTIEAQTTTENHTLTGTATAAAILSCSGCRC